MALQPHQQKLLNLMQDHPTARFFPAFSPLEGGSPVLMIQDYHWWTDNEREILNWMAEHLPRGIDHQAGMTIDFDTKQDRMLFLLRWS